MDQENFQSWWKNINEELYLLKKYLIPLIKKAFADAFFSWTKLFVLSALSIFYSFVITAYKKDTYEISQFFPPNSGYGLALALLTIFIYRLPVNIAKKIKELDTELEAFNWNNIDVCVADYKIVGLSGWGVKITNNKETTINVSAFVTRYKESSYPESKFNRERLLAHVWEQKGELNMGYARIEKGKSAIFAITTKENLETASYEIRTHGQTIDFSNDMLVDVNLEADIPDRNPLWIPTLFYIGLNVNKDGKILIRDMNKNLKIQNI